MANFDGTQHMTPIQLAQLAHRLADRAVVADIESECVRILDPDGRHWYDTRPMLDTREHSYECVDMNRDALQYAVGRGLAVPNAELDYMVRIVRDRIGSRP